MIKAQNTWKFEEETMAMKFEKTSLAILTVALGMFLSGCYQCTDTYEATVYSPVYLSRAELKNSLKADEPRFLEEPGKIYAKDQLFFIVEDGKGIHIIDNHDPSQPENVSFIEIPGCTEIQMKNNALIVNSAVDLVTIDITDIQNPKELGRIESMFPFEMPLSSSSVEYYETPDHSKGLVIGWDKQVSEKTKNCNQ